MGGDHKIAWPPIAVTNGGSYNCRGRNNDASAKISEHGRGNAFDLGPVKLADGAVRSEQQVYPRNHFGSAYGTPPAIALVPCLGRDQIPITPIIFT